MLFVRRKKDRLDGFRRLIVFQLICTKGYKLLCYIVYLAYNCIINIIKEVIF